MIRFDLSNQRLPAALSKADVKKTGRIMSKLLRVKTPVEAALHFVSEQEITRLNSTYLHKNRPTDVLSFPTPPFFHATRYTLHASQGTFLGDIIICPVFAAREARRRSIPLKQELVRLLVHGILHVKGYDHGTERDEMRMFRVQERAVELIVT